jgi:hypothetical protein
MPHLTIPEIGRRLENAGRLRAKSLCVFGADAVPDDAEPMGKINRCVAKAVLHIAMKGGPAGFLGDEALGGCCPGGQSWLGFVPFLDELNYFVSTGTRGFRNGAAEHLKRTPELVRSSRSAAGEIKAPGRYIVIRRAEEVRDEQAGARSFICFGNAEQVRNLVALHHFGSSDTFGSALMPWGPTCATLVTYPAGLTSNAPQDAIFVGPVDPTGNEWFPEEFMVAAMPIDTARRMCADLEASFIAKRPKVAYPEKREQMPVRPINQYDGAL